MINPPNMRVDEPHDVVHAVCCAPSASRNWISNTRAKFCPSSWLVPICSALPSRIIASHDSELSAPAKPLLRSLEPDDDGHREHVHHDAFVDLVRDPFRVRVRLGLRRVRGVAFLPEELGGAEEEPRPELPPHDVGPLVEEERQVAVALQPLRHVLADDRLTRGSHDDGLVELLAARDGDDGEFRTEPLDVLGLALEVRLGDEEREVRVLGSARLDAGVDLGLQPLPEAVPVRADDHRPADGAILGKLRLVQDILVPAGEVVGLRRQDGHGAEGSEGHAGERLLSLSTKPIGLIPDLLTGISGETRVTSSGMAIDVLELRAQPLEPEIEEELRSFEDGARRFIAGEIDDDVFRVFRLNQGIYGQRQGGFNQMVRVKIPYGRVEPDQLEMFGYLAENYSRGWAHLTTRQNVQFHFVQLEHAGEMLRLLASVGLTSREACGDTVRNVAGCHLAGACPYEVLDISPWAEAAKDLFLRNPISQRLPRKFKINFSGLRHRLRPGDVQRRRRDRGEPAATRRHRRAGLQGVHGRRTRREPAPRAGVGGIHDA